MIMRFPWLWPVIILLSTIAASIVTFITPEIMVRPAIILWFLFFCPGMALIRFIRIREFIAECTLAVASSFTIDAIVTVSFMYAGRWSLTGIFGTLLGISLGGAILQLVTLRSVVVAVPAISVSGVSALAETPLPIEALPQTEGDLSTTGTKPLVGVAAGHRGSEQLFELSIADQETRPLAAMVADSWKSGHLSEGSIADEATRPLVAILARPLAAMLAGTGNLSEENDSDEDTVLISAIRRPSVPDTPALAEESVADQDTMLLSDNAAEKTVSLSDKRNGDKGSASKSEKRETDEDTAPRPIVGHPSPEKHSS